MMKTDDVKTLIDDLDDFIMRGVSTEKIEEQEFDKLMQHIYEGGTYDLNKFTTSKSKLDANINNAKRLLGYGDKSQEAIIADAKAKKQKLEEMIKKIDGLREKAVEKEIEKAENDFEILDFKKYQDDRIAEKNNELTDIDSSINEYNDIKSKMDKDGNLTPVIIANNISLYVARFNNDIKEYKAEIAKPDDKKDQSKIEKLEESLNNIKISLEKINLKDFLGEAAAKPIQDIMGKELKDATEIDEKDIKAKYKDVCKKIDKKQIQDLIKNNDTLKSELLRLYNARTSRNETDINNIDVTKMYGKDFLLLRQFLNGEVNKLSTEKQTIVKEIAAKEKTIKEIEKTMLLKENNKSTEELWNTYATGEQKNQMQEYKASYWKRFGFLVKVNTNGKGWLGKIVGAVKTFVDARNVEMAEMEVQKAQVEDLKNEAKQTKNSFGNKFKESLRNQVKQKNIKVEQRDMDEIYKDMTDNDKGDRE